MKIDDFFPPNADEIAEAEIRRHDFSALDHDNLADLALSLAIDRALAAGAANNLLTMIEAAIALIDANRFKAARAILAHQLKIAERA